MTDSQKIPRVTNDSPISRIRIQRRLTQAQLAKLCGTSTNNISRWEIGAATPNGKNLMKLAEALGCSMEDLIQK